MTIDTNSTKPGSVAGAWGSRYGSPVPAQEATALPSNSVLGTLLNHRTVRRFSDAPVPAGYLEAIAAAAQSAATSSHLQAWSMLVVADTQRKARLAELAGHQQHVADAPLLLVFLADLARLRTVGAWLDTAVDGLDYFESLVIAIADATLAAQNSVVAAESLGLGCCYIGAMRNKPEAVASELGLPKEVFAVFGLVIGFPGPDGQTEIKPRFQQAAVMHRERYEGLTSQALEDFDVVMRGFQRQQGMAESGWTGKAAARVRGAASLTGRDELKQALQRMGFGLL